MAKIEFEGKEYKSRAELARELLMRNTMRKSEISKITGIAAQTVHGNYKRLVASGKMEDVYPELIERLDKEEMDKRNAKAKAKEEEKKKRKDAKLSIRAKKKEAIKKAISKTITKKETVEEVE
ncbi:MAG: hypothetical protein WC260_01455 [Candidatus Pacearchaeota archaeon]